GARIASVGRPTGATLLGEHMAGDRLAKRAAACRRGGVLAMISRRVRLEATMDQADGRTITFRCPPELEPILPRPIAATLGLPEWFKAMPQTAFSAALQHESRTVKKCPPFID